MGEYALHGRDEVKIGTCEDLFYLRFDQAGQVAPLPGNVNPMTDVYEIRFRFPFPDEDGILPGQFHDHDRGVEIPGYEPPTYMVDATGGKATGPVKVIQQKLVKGDDAEELQTVVLVQTGSTFGDAFRLSRFESMKVMACFVDAAGEALEAGDPYRCDFQLKMAARVGLGYTENGVVIPERLKVVG